MGCLCVTRRVGLTWCDVEIGDLGSRNCSVGGAALPVAEFDLFDFRGCW